MVKGLARHDEEYYFPGFYLYGGLLILDISQIPPHLQGMLHTLGKAFAVTNRQISLCVEADAAAAFFETSTRAASEFLTVLEKLGEGSLEPRIIE